MQIELPFGPWTRLVNAEWGTYPTVVYMNPDKVMLMIVFEKTNEQTTGMLVALKKVFVVKGSIPSSVLVSQKREITFIEKYSRIGSASYMLVSSTPTYAKYSEEELIDAIRKQYEELTAVSSISQEMVAAYKAKAIELKNSSDEVIQLFLGDPFLTFSLLNPEVARRREAKALITFLLGKQKNEKQVQVPLETLALAAVSGGSLEKRLHAIHLLCEGAILSSVSCMIFDSSNSLAGLGNASKETAGFPQFGMTAMPLGFPYKNYELGNGLYIDLSLVSSDFFLKTFGLEEADASLPIKKGHDARKPSSISELIAEISNLKETHEITQYTINKAIRILQVIQKNFPSLFAKNNVSDLLVPWHEGVAKVFHVNTSKYPPQIQYLLVQSILNAFPSPPTGKAMSLVIAFDKDAAEISKEIAAALDKLRERGVGSIVQTEHDIDLSAFKNISLKIDFVEENEVVAKFAGEKPTRLALRPAFTQCMERK